MASELLFDISAIDLSAVAYGRDVISKFNPQTGDMCHLDHMVWTDDNFTSGLGVKHVRDDEFWVQGHIPGRPLLPGVIMIEAAAQVSSVIYQLRLNEDKQRFLGFTRCDNCVFRGQVVPGDTLYILVREHNFQRRRFSCDAQGIVNGKLVFEVRITGMNI